MTKDEITKKYKSITQNDVKYDMNKIYYTIAKHPVALYAKTKEKESTVKEKSDVLT